MQAAALASSLGFALAGGALTGGWRLKWKNTLLFFCFQIKEMFRLAEKNKNIQ